MYRRTKIFLFSRCTFNHSGINEYTLKNRHCTREQYEENKESEKQLEAYLDEVAKRAFKAAIIVNIDLPNDVEKFEEAVK